MSASAGRQPHGVRGMTRALSKERPAWQREVMRPVAVADVFSDEDYDRLVETSLQPRSFLSAVFGLEQLPQATPEDLPVRLVSIEKPEHVNALESKEPLTFELRGLTIIYGDNASGKSGYARLLKRIARASSPGRMSFRRSSVTRHSQSRPRF